MRVTTYRPVDVGALDEFLVKWIEVQRALCGEFGCPHAAVYRQFVPKRRKGSPEEHEHHEAMLFGEALITRAKVLALRD